MFKERIFTLTALGIVVIGFVVNFFVKIPQLSLVCAAVLAIGLIIDRLRGNKTGKSEQNAEDKST